MSAVDEMFDKVDVDREQRTGRPMIVPPEGGELVPYTRASSLSDFIEDQRGLIIYERRLLAKGLSEREDLAALGASLPPLTGNKRVDAVTKKSLDEVIARAIDQGRGWAKADYGTAIHSFTDPGASSHVPERMRSDVASFDEAMKCLRIVETSRFIVNDDLRVAGTYDHIVWVPGVGFLMTDKKTGKLHPHGFAIQMSTYANGLHYDWETGERTKLPFEVRKDWGLVIHVEAGTGSTTLHLIDLAAGYEAAGHAAWVRDWRARRDLIKPLDKMEFINSHIIELIGGATTREELVGIATEFEPVWHSGLTLRGAERLAELGC
jgi:hypothetical protein